jgi:hypothetical protein
MPDSMWPFHNRRLIDADDFVNVLGRRSVVVTRGVQIPLPDCLIENIVDEALLDPGRR